MSPAELGSNNNFGLDGAKILPTEGLEITNTPLEITVRLLLAEPYGYFEIPLYSLLYGTL